MERLGDALVRREGRDVGEDGLEALGDVVQAGLVGQRLREQRLEGGWLDRVGDGVHGSGHRGDCLPAVGATSGASVHVAFGARGASAARVTRSRARRPPCAARAGATEAIF